MHEPRAALLQPLEEPRDRSLTDDLRQLADDARTFAEAELAFQKTRATYAAAEAKGIAILGVVAAVFVFFAVMALVVGTVIALAPLITAWGAMAAVVLGLSLIAAICVITAKRRINQLICLAGPGNGTS